MRRFLPLALLAVLVLPARGQRLDAAVRAHVTPFVEAATFAGAVLVTRGDTVLARMAFGEAAPGRPNTPATVFRIGSVTKPITSAAVLRLVADGRLRLDAPVCTYLADCPAAWAPVTLRHLLTHRSGVPSFTGFPDFAARRPYPSPLDSTLARFRDRPLDFAPGERFAYSNSGYVVLGKVLETVSGRPYADVVRERVTGPLGLGATGYDTGAVPGRARPMRAGTTRPVPADSLHMTIPHAAGGLVSTVDDLRTFARAVLRPGFLPDSLRRAMLTPPASPPPYALGWSVDPFEGGSLVSHSGGIEGFSAYLAYAPAHDLTVVVLSNVEAAPTGRLARDLVRLALGQSVPAPTVRRAVELPDADLDAYVGTYRVAPAFALTVRRAPAGGLETQATGQSAAPLFAEGPDRFFLRVVDAQLRFQRGADGRVTGLTLLQNGQEIPATKE